MKSTQTAGKKSPHPEAVLTKAVLRAAAKLEITHKDLSQILGVSAASASRLGKSRFIAPDSKEGELALLFVRLFRSLDALLGGHEGACVAWLAAPNMHLGGTPRELVQTVVGLTEVVGYVDALRAKV